MVSIPNGFALARLIWTAAGDPEPMISTIGLELTPGPTTPFVLASAIRTAWTGAWAPASLSNSYTFKGVSVTMGPQPGTGPTADSLIDSIGTSVSAMLPSNCAILIRKVTALGGRENRGRMFLPAGYLAEGSVDQNGVIAGATVTSMQAQMNAFQAAVIGSPLFDNTVVLHGTASASAPTVITDLTVQSKIATQRRRMRR